MNHKTEVNLVLYYLNNLLKRPLFGDLEDRICDWFDENSRELIGRNVANLWENHRRIWNRKAKDGTEEQLLPRDTGTLKKWLANKSGCFVHTPDVTALIDAFHLAPEYHEVLALRVHTANSPLLNSLAESHHSGRTQQIFAGMLNLSMRRYEQLFSQSGELLTKGLFEVSRMRDHSHEMTETLNEILLSHCRTQDAVKRTVLGKPQKATLKPEHFEHLEEEYIWIKNLLSGTLSKQQRGVNVLIYGNPGTGKTEIVKTLCREIGASLYTVSNNRAEERTGVGRRYDLAGALCLLEGDRNSVLLMDEAEDVFDVDSNGVGVLRMGFGRPAPSAPKSKLFFNKLLESNSVPVVWISNNIEGVDPAHLRRFSYALNMEAPNDTVQARIWEHSAKKNKVKLPKEKINRLVKSYDIAPGIIDTSLRTAALTGDQEAIEKTIESLQTAIHGRSGKKEFVLEHEFSTALLNCDVDLANLAQRIMALKGVNFSLCLYGIPGSGKSAYARYLADQLKMKVLHKRASDLISPYVGMTEQYIAKAFAEARKKKMLLVIDEADSFLRDRRYARESWEVTNVNEMLTQMESHPLPFVCTTNLMDDLDKASLRRFTFKVKYDYLTREQVKIAFQHFFGMEPSVSLAGLHCLSPGDFAVVAKKVQICGFADQSELAELLRREQQVKDVRSSGSLGFAVS